MASTTPIRLPAEIDYYVDQGMNVFRIPFRWERLQRSLSAALDGTESARLSSVVAYATGLGAHVILDPHNYARYYGALVGSGSVPNSAFADFWSRLAAQYKSNPRVIFGLMNEPHDMPTEQWVAAANAAIAAIRAAGAQNLILVPGNGWTGAHSWSDGWYGTPNAVAMQGIIDPSRQLRIRGPPVPGRGLLGNQPGNRRRDDRIAAPGRLHQLAASPRPRGLLGEFAVARQTIGNAGGQIGDEALADMLGYIEANADVWLGWTWWAGGPWWGEYMFTLEPQNLGQANETDRPQLAVMQPHLSAGARVRTVGWCDRRHASGSRPPATLHGLNARAAPFLQSASPDRRY